MAAAEPAVPAVPGSAGTPSGAVPVLFCFSVFARPSSVPHGAGYELLIQKFLSLYGDQIDLHRKFVVQLFAEEWGQYVDLPKGFAVSERCKVRLVPLQIQVGSAAAAPGVPVRAALLRCPARLAAGRAAPRSQASGAAQRPCSPEGGGPQPGSAAAGAWASRAAARRRPHVRGPQPPVSAPCRERVPAARETGGLCPGSRVDPGVVQDGGEETVGRLGFTTCGNTNLRSRTLSPSCSPALSSLRLSLPRPKVGNSCLASC